MSEVTIRITEKDLRDALKATREVDVANFDASNLPAAMGQRLQTVWEDVKPAAAATAASLKADKPILDVLMRRASEPKIGRIERVKRFRRLADRYAQSVQPHAACARSCTHCCHVGVQIFESEANLIGKAIGRVPQPMQGISEPQLFGYESPCPFLLDGACSIYDERPIACRLQFNMDRDALLCQLVADQTVPVPYMDHTNIDLLVLQTLAGEAIADVREWFPG